ncbi:translocation/assembly module TamB domain-containing protein [Hahella ganghwensis]|uniref:translocation/assembly module TamB domain-containing protein n=1 Tax=Hahella ganghwensis TaxID=286420 RepID=UPI0012F7803F|nr:translocation/assembly module TamB domain-containing protein [Hahella ganghwensis]
MTKPAAVDEASSDKAQAGESPEKPTGKRRLKHVTVKAGRVWLLSLAHLSAGLMTFLLALFAVVALVLGSEGGRLWLVNSVLPTVLQGTEYQMEIESPSSPDLGHWTFERLAFSIDQEPVIDARHLEIQVAWQKLFNKTIDVSLLQAASLEVWVAETGAGEPVEEEGQSFEISELSVSGLPAIRIQQLGMTQVRINVPGQDIPPFSANGQLMAFWGDNWLESALKVNTLTDLAAEISLDGKLTSASNGAVNLTLVEPAGGWIGRQMQIPARQPLDINLQLEATRRHRQLVDIDLQDLRVPWQSHVLDSHGQMTVDVASRRLTLHSLLLSLDGAPQKISGTLSEEEANLDLVLNQLPLTLVEPWVPKLKGGQVSGQVALTGVWNEIDAQGKLSAQTQYDGYPANIQVKGGGNQHKIRLDSVEGSLGALRIQVGGEVDVENSRLDLKIREFEGSLGYLSLLEVELTNDLLLQFKVSDASVTGPWDSPDYQGRLQATGSFRERPLSVKGAFKGNIQQIQLSNARLDSLQSRLDASGVIDWDKGLVDLQAVASEVPFQLLEWVEVEIPEGLEGAASAKGRVWGPFDNILFDGRAEVAGRWREARIKIDSLLNASARRVEFRDLDARLNMSQRSGMENIPEGCLQASGTLDIEKLSIDASTTISDLPFAVLQLADVEYPSDLEGTLSADLELNGTLPLPVVQGSLVSRGSLAGEPFSINIGGKGQQDRVDFNNTRIEWRDSVLMVAGYIAPDSYNLELELAKFDTQYLRGFGVDVLPAKVDLTASVKGTPQHPEITGQMNASATYTLGPDASRKPSEFNWIMAFYLQDETLRVDNDLLENDKKHGNLDLSLAWRPYFERWQEDPAAMLQPDLPLDLSVSGDLDIAWLNELVDEDIQTIRGRTNIDLKMSGRLSAPELYGSVSVREGFYENQLTQTTMDDIGMELAFRGNEFEIIQGSASDTLGGHLYATGYSRWNDGNHGKVDLKVTADKMSLLRRDDMEGAVSGELMATGDLQNILVSGNIEVSPFQLLLDLIPNSDIPELEVTVRRQEELSGTTMDSEIPIPDVTLDITLRVDQQGFIRGRGLDAELQGEVRVTGPLEASNYKGEFSVVRGTFELFGKRFNLSNGNVIFANESIAMLVEGRHVASDLEYIATLSGTLEELNISLRTIPDLPEDEALSRLLFGKSIQNISPLQAARLAAAVQTLRGEGGFDPIAATRDVLGVDTLTIDSQETENGESGVAVGVGKYVTEKVYVELERTPEPSQPWKGSVEIELTPKLNLETTTGGKSGFGGVELLWKHDY